MHNEICNSNAGSNRQTLQENTFFVTVQIVAM